MSQASRTGFTLCAGALLFLTSCAQAPEGNIPSGYTLFYEETFDDEKSLRPFEFTDAVKWRLGDSARGSQALEFTGPGPYRPKYRSPVIIGLIADAMYGDFILEADVCQTGREYGHRDLCIFFALQYATHFYYVHLASEADEASHNIFLVDGKDRAPIAEKASAGVNWGPPDTWHKVRVERRLHTGEIKVYFDNMETPIMTAKHTALTTGYIGFGSFDDSGKVDNIRIWAPQRVVKNAEIYEKMK
jgi:hypothetical protein